MATAIAIQPKASKRRAWMRAKEPTNDWRKEQQTE